MNQKITLDALGKNTVSVKTQQYTTIDGKEYALGQPHRKAYQNSAKGRENVQNELPQPQQDSIFLIWGDSPTVVPSQ